MAEPPRYSIGDTIFALILVIPAVLMAIVIGIMLAVGLMIEDACCWAKRKADRKRERDAKHSD